MENSDRRKSRLSITPEQHKVLLDNFAICAFPNSARRLKLAGILNISPRSIQIWFQNRRQKAKSEGVRVDEMHSEVCGHRVTFIRLSSPYRCKSLDLLANLACMEYYRRHDESSK